MRKYILSIIVSLLLVVVSQLAFANTAGTNVVFSELGINPPGTETGKEFVELYNPTAASINISGWMLKSKGSPDWNITFPSNATIKAYGYYLIGNNISAWGSNVNPDYRYNVTLLNSNYGVRLFNSTGGIVDTVGWGNVLSLNGYFETAALADALLDSHTYERRPGYLINGCGNWNDTDNNANDFIDNVLPTPKNASYTEIKCNSDNIPPLSVLGLTNTSRDLNSIKWSWTNPSDRDFNSNIIYLNNVNVANTSSNSYNATGLTADTSYTLKIHTKDNLGNINTTDVTSTASTMRDTKAPATVTGITNPSKGTTWLYWTWNNPADADFNKNIIYINGTNVANTSNNFYNATGLLSNKSYTIKINTVDTSNNINTTNVNNTATTMAVDLTPPGKVAALVSPSKGNTWIYWQWANPIDADFSQAILYLNGINIANTSNSNYNATGLAQNTTYTMVVNTKDTSGNVNTTNVNSTVTTTYIPIACFSNSDCTDGNAHTEDICQNAGTTSAVCLHNPITCLSNSECGTNGLLNQNFCSNNNVYDYYVTYTCNNAGTSGSSCSNSTASQLKESCTYGCRNNACIAATEIACFNNAECNDGNAHTEDSCINPGLITSYCQNTNIACLSNSECGSASTNVYCNGLNLVENLTTPACINAGTTGSYCRNDSSITSSQCAFECSTTLGCDFVVCNSGSGSDYDWDHVCGSQDFCPYDANNDIDEDEVCGNLDNCPEAFNPDQTDSDSDGIGNACEGSTIFACSDSIDNDQDGYVDYPADLGCSNANDNNEGDGRINCTTSADCGSVFSQGSCSGLVYITSSATPTCYIGGTEHSYCQNTLVQMSNVTCDSACSASAGCYTPTSGGGGGGSRRRPVTTVTPTQEEETNNEYQISEYAPKVKQPKATTTEESVENGPSASSGTDNGKNQTNSITGAAITNVTGIWNLGNNNVGSIAGIAVLILLLALAGWFIYGAKKKAKGKKGSMKIGILLLLGIVMTIATVAIAYADNVVISEVLFNPLGPEDKEFIELYNPTNATVNIGGWKIYSYSAADANLVIPAGATIKAYGYYLIGDESLTWNASLTRPDIFAEKLYLTNVNAGISIKDSSNNIVDMLGWGTAGSITTGFYEGVPASSYLTEGYSYERKPANTQPNCGNWIDTNNNANDFVSNANPAPQNSSSTSETPCVPDTTAPKAINGLTNNGKGVTWLSWTWNNPTDSDFYQNMIYLNGVNVANTSNNKYNVTGLNGNTSYTIKVHTMDNSGNVNSTDVTNTQTTLPVPAPVLVDIDNIQVKNLADTSATIYWETNVDSDSTVRYGTTAGLGSTASASGSSKVHSVLLTGLAKNVRYYYTVTSCTDGFNCNTSVIYDFTTLNIEDDLQVNYIRGKILMDGIAASSSATFNVEVTSGNNAGQIFSSNVDSNVPTALQGRGYFETLDQMKFMTGATFKVTADNCNGSATGTFQNGGNGNFINESSLIVLSCNVPPVISDVSNSPAAPTEVNDTIISANITDLVGLSGVSVNYTVNGVNSYLKAMALEGGLYKANISTFNVNDTIAYYVIAVDAYNTVKSAVHTFSIGASDLDGDSVWDKIDNCPSVYNPTQLDTDHDGKGDACDPYECNDSIDNDGDSLIDMNDFGCDSLTDNNETDECLTDADCTNLDHDFCNGNVWTYANGICNASHKCVANNTVVEDCSAKGGVMNDCGSIIWGCSEELNEVRCVITSVDGNDTLCANNCNSLVLNTNGQCNDVSLLCEFTQTNCNDNNAYTTDACNATGGVCQHEGITCLANTDCGSVLSDATCYDLDYVVSTTTPTCINAGTTASYCINNSEIMNTTCDNICGDLTGCDYTACSDGMDNDADTYIDWPTDLGCEDFYDDTEGDGIVNCTSNADCGSVEWSYSCATDTLYVVSSTTPTCINANTEYSYCTNITSETNEICSNICSASEGCDYTQCSDTLDNDNDTFVDFPADPGCDNLTDNNETNECDTDSDCNNLDSSYCIGQVLTWDEGICVNHKCTFNTTTVEDCAVKNGTINECGDLTWSCSEELNEARCVLIQVTPDNSLCPENCNSLILEDNGICNNSTMLCNYQITDCNDNNAFTFDECTEFSYNNASCINTEIECFNNTDCGDILVSNTCDLTIFSVATTTPTCINGGTVNSTCLNVTVTQNETCSNICSATEGCDYTECSDLADNDTDTYIDWPLDLGCVDYYDDNESDGTINCTTNADCGTVAWDYSCASDTLYVVSSTTPTCYLGGTEHSYCMNVTAQTNETCSNICSATEGCDYTECSDSTDNDADTFIDFPLDIGCIDYYDNNESDGPINCTTNADCGAERIYFEKKNISSEDCMTDNVCFKRGNSGMIFNSKQENVSNNSVSPKDTIWATGTCAAPNSTFGTFYNVVCEGACGSNVLNKDLCAHLVSEDKYVDFYFTNWTSTSQGAVFAYYRSNPNMSVQKCIGNDFITETVFPTCNLAGTERSYCTYPLTVENETCSNICSATEGCDYTECSDTTDNDADTFIDWPLDLGCTDYYDNNESDGPINCTTNTDCGTVAWDYSCASDTLYIVSSTTPTCYLGGTEHSYCMNITAQTNETCSNICSATEGCDYTECSDLADNDTDTFIDWPLDLGCTDYYDDNESDGPINCTTNTDCGTVAWDYSCASDTLYIVSSTTPTCYLGGTEHSYCMNITAQTNETCSNICSATEGCDYTECSDTTDNDVDTFIDWPLDLGCTDYYDDNESDGPINCTTNTDCGTVAWDYSCASDTLYVVSSTTPTCYLGGTEHSYCMNITAQTNETCNYICSGTLGCDYTECSDSADNDADTFIDYPLDLGCTNYIDDNESDGTINCTTNADCGSVSISEHCEGDESFITETTTPTCNNGGTEHSYCTFPVTTDSDACSHICSDTLGCDYTECSDLADNDADTFIDWPLDLGCTDYYDDNESDGTINCTINADCGARIDATSCSLDNMTFTLNSTIPTCMNAGTEHSYCVNLTEIDDTTCSHICSNTLGCDYTECSDLADNDADTFIDWPLDLGCIDYYDDNESDGPINCTTNDDCGCYSVTASCGGTDNLVYTISTTTPTCFNAGSEHSYCADVVNTTNDQCNHLCSDAQGCDYTECSDSSDNDADTYIDFPLDLGCSNYTDDDESDGPINCTVNTDCGVETSSQRCIDLNFAITTITPTCLNAGTEHSYCANVTTTSTDTCNHICSNESGCDYTECSDSMDNDHDLHIDFPSDLGCTDYYDNNESDGTVNCSSNLECGSITTNNRCIGIVFTSTTSTPTCRNAGTEYSYCENVSTVSTDNCDYICSGTLGCDYTQCSDSLDNDLDLTIDFPADPGCSSYNDNNESDGPINCTSNSDCCEGCTTVDQMCEGNVFRIKETVPTCFNPGTEQSYCANVTNILQNDTCDHICSDTQGCDYTQCSDSVDNDADTTIDFPLDLGCTSYFDNYEGDGTVNCTANIDCGTERIDNACSGNAYSRRLVTPTCVNAGRENSYCSDVVYILNQTNCSHICSNTQGCDYTQCSDSMDNDVDGYIDFPADPGCVDYYDNNELGGLNAISVNIVSPADNSMFEVGSNIAINAEVADTNRNAVITSYVWQSDISGQLLNGSGMPPNITAMLPEGRHTVSLTIVDNYGLTAQDSVIINVHGHTTAMIIADPEKGLAPLNVSFDANATGPGVLTYYWDFDASNGIQNDSTIKSPVVMFSNVGNYTVTLTVLSDGGMTGRAVATKVIEVMPIVPVVILPQEDGDMVIERFAIVNEEKLKAGDFMTCVLDVRNRGNVDLDNVRLQIAIPELGISRRAGPFDLDKGQSTTRTLKLFIPLGTDPGQYLVRASAYDEEAKRVQHRDIVIQK
jgi:hypothetical protein